MEEKIIFSPMQKLAEQLQKSLNDFNKIYGYILNSREDEKTDENKRIGGDM